MIDGVIVMFVCWTLIFLTTWPSKSPSDRRPVKTFGLSVRGAGGAPKPTAVQSAIRNSWTLLPIIPLVGGLLGFVAIIIIAVTINGSPTKQGKHDELAGGTQVVKG